MPILGMIWADTRGVARADPKSPQPSSPGFCTYLLHARVVRDWRGNRAAWLLIIGIAVVATYFSNLVLGGTAT